MSLYNMTSGTYLANVHMIEDSRTRLKITDTMVDATGNSRKVCQVRRIATNALLQNLEGLSAPSKSFALLQMPEGYINTLLWNKVERKVHGPIRNSVRRRHSIG